MYCYLAVIYIYFTPRPSHVWVKKKTICSPSHGTTYCAWSACGELNALFMRAHNTRYWLQFDRSWEPCKICLREEIRENYTEKSGKHVSEVFLDYIAGKKRFMFVLLHLKEFLLYVHEVFSCSSHQSLNLKNIISRTTKHSWRTICFTNKLCIFFS